MKGSHFSSDIQEFFRLLAKHSVKYVIVGGEAVIHYGFARLTGDVDIFYEGSKDNSTRLFEMLKEFWSGSIPGLLKPEELLESDSVFQFGVPPNRIDLISRIDGVSFEETWEGREAADLELTDINIEIAFIGLDQLIKNKKALKRYRDLEDLKYLNEERIKRTDSIRE
jgi:hypothetical protein